MRDPGRRVVIAILGVALSLAIAGCAAEDNPPTSPGDSTTTEPVGS
jgi:hypothetical protein